MDRDEIVMSPEMQDAMQRTQRVLCLRRVYTNPDAKGEEGKAIHMITSLYQYYMEHLEAMPEVLSDHSWKNEGEPEEMMRVCDYIAGMTDTLCRGRSSGIFYTRILEILKGNQSSLLNNLA